MTPLGIFLFGGDVGARFHSIFSLFLLISMSNLVVCSSIDIPLEWFDPWPAFYHFLLCIRRFLAKSHIHTQVVGQKLRIHAGFWPKVTYIHSCSLNSRVHPPFWWVWCCGKFLGGLWVWLGLPWVWCCLFEASFVTKDHFFIDFSLK